MKIPPESMMFPGRGVSLRGQFYTREINGRLYVSRWPKSQPTPRTAKEADTRKLFAVAARVTTMMTPQEQSFARDLAKESKLLPRDFLMIALFNRIGTVVLRNGRKIYNMPAIQDVSAMLDALWQLKGGILVRGNTLWEGIPAGEEGQLLRMDANGLPAWADPSVLPGAPDWYMQPILLKPNIAGITINPAFFSAVPIIGTSQVLLSGIRLWITAAGSGRTIRAALYSSNGLTLSGGTNLALSNAVNVTTGLLTVPFLTPYLIQPNTFYWLGVNVLSGSGNVQIMTSDLTRNNYMFFSAPGPTLPGTAPASTAGTGATQFTWWGY